MALTEEEGLVALIQKVLNAFKTDTPEGYNSDRRFKARWILWGAVFGLVRSRLLLAAGCATASIVVLKEGKLLSAKNLKWMVLSIISFAAGTTAWALGRAHDAIDEDRAYVFKSLLRLSSTWIRLGWALVMGLFLVSAYLASPKDQAALKAAVERVGDAAEAAGEKGKKAAGKAAGAAAKRLDEFSKKME